MQQPWRCRFPARASRVWPVCACALVVLWIGYSVFAQPQAAAQFRVYSLKYKSARDVEKLLVEMLADSDSETHIVADMRQNQLLVQGSESVQETARRLIESVDRPAVAPRKTSEPVVRTYSCPVRDIPSVAEKLRSLYGRRDGLRVATVPETSQLMVLAPPEIHEIVARQLSLEHAPAGSDLTRAADPPRSRDESGRYERRLAAGSREWGAGGGESTVESFAPIRRDEPEQQFFRLNNTRVDRVESMLQGLLGKRLRADSADRSGYRFMNSTGGEVRFHIDRGRNGLTVSGDEAVRRQFARLLHLLDSPPLDADRKVRLVPVQRADPAKIKRAVEAYRGDDRNDEQRRRKRERSSAVDLQGEDQSRLSRPAEIELAAFQESAAGAPATGGQQPGAEDLEPDETGRRRGLHEMGADVDIEILPDLDIVIIRGRDYDVGEVTRIIQELERLSAETQPEIEIYPLKHVRGESLVTIIQGISEDLVGGRQGRVSVTPLVKPNALLLIGWGEAVEAIKSLIRKLDQPVSPQTQLKVFRLRHAAVTAAQTTVQQFFTGRAGLGPQVRASADVRSNSLIVEASPRDMAEVELLIKRLDTPDSPSANRVRMFRLKNSLAADLGRTLEAAVQAARGGTGARRSAVLELLTIDAEGQRILKSGLLNDVEITPDARTNTLVISGPAESMPLLEALITQLDEAAMTTAQIKVFRILNGDAGSLIQMLRSLLPAQAGTSSVPQLSSAEGEVSMAPLRFAVDIRTNSIIATGSAGELQIIEALLIRLDEKDVRQRQSMVYRLKNAPTIDVARAISSFLRSEQQVQEAAPGSVSPFLQIEREVIVVPEPVSNSLIISATPRFFEDIMKLVEQLDAQPPQVMIQVLIAELSLDNTDEFGVELGLQDSILFDRSLLGELVKLTETTTSPNGVQTTTERIISQEATPGFLFNNQTLGNNVAMGPGSVAGQGLSSFTVGRVNNELGFGGLVLSASSESVSILVRALQESRRLEVLSRPQIMTLDNQPAYIQVGERVPRIIGSQISQVGQVNNIALENVGLILAVTPRISPEGMVVMEIDAEKSDLGAEADGIPVSTSTDGTVIRSPRINLATAQTTVSAASGETIVLGGLITKGTASVSRRVPWLADIPLLGNLFRYDSLVSERKELIIIMTPQVVLNAEDTARLKFAETARLHWCTSDVHELHGDGSFCEPGTCPICNSEVPVIYPDVNPRGSLPAHPEVKENMFPPAPAPVPRTVPKTPEEKAHPGKQPPRLRIPDDAARLNAPGREELRLTSGQSPAAPETGTRKTGLRRMLPW